MKALLAMLALAMLPAAAPAQEKAAKPTAKVALYKTADSAACPPDVPVWVDPARQVYYVKGDPLFGKTRPGGWNCRRNVEAAGYQAAKR
jgi:hypothetical protein